LAEDLLDQDYNEFAEHWSEYLDASSVTNASNHGGSAGQVFSYIGISIGIVLGIIILSWGIYELLRKWCSQG